MGSTCSSGVGVTAKCPAKGRFWAAIMTIATDAAEAKSAIAIAAVRRLPLCTNAIASRVRTASEITAAHLAR